MLGASPPTVRSSHSDYTQQLLLSSTCAVQCNAVQAKQRWGKAAAHPSQPCPCPSCFCKPRPHCTFSTLEHWLPAFAGDEAFALLQYAASSAEVEGPGLAGHLVTHFKAYSGRLNGTAKHLVEKWEAGERFPAAAADDSQAHAIVKASVKLKKPKRIPNKRPTLHVHAACRLLHAASHQLACRLTQARLPVSQPPTLAVISMSHMLHLLSAVCAAAAAMCSHDVSVSRPLPGACGAEQRS